MQLRLSPKRAAGGDQQAMASSEWMSLELAVERYVNETRSASQGYLASDSWSHIHARFEA